MKKIAKFLITFISSSLAVSTLAAEVPLCQLPQANTNTAAGEPSNAACSQVLEAAKKLAEASKSQLNFFNSSTIPSQLNVGSVYLQPITMLPTGMMLPRKQSDIHLELDIHAQQNLKARGFAPGDWLPNVTVSYTIQKIGDKSPLPCSSMSTARKYTCLLMPMVASDGPHYGNNVKLQGPGFYLVTFNATTANSHFGWHTDTDSKVLGTEYVDWHFTQSYIFKWTGVGKIGGY